MLNRCDEVVCGYFGVVCSVFIHPDYIVIKTIHTARDETTILFQFINLKFNVLNLFRVQLVCEGIKPQDGNFSTFESESAMELIHYHRLT